MAFGIVLAACQSESGAQNASSQPVVEAPATDEGEAFRAVMTRAREDGLHERPLGEVMQTVGEHFLGMPYVAGLLDVPDEEQLIVSFDGFDCVLFVETVLALSRGITAQDYSFDGFMRRIEDQRYRDGEMNGYCSRLHYFSEWIADNERRGTIRNITADIGGKRLDKQLTFMTANRSSYRRIANDATFACIREMEGGVADLELFYVPQDRIASVYDRLQSGDIVATATDIDGLDVTHTGLIYKTEDGGTGFIHASLSGAVRIDTDLQAYVKGNRRQIGVIIARPVSESR